MLQDQFKYRENSKTNFSSNARRADESSVSFLCTTVFSWSCSDRAIFSNEKLFKMQDQKGNSLYPNRFGCITPQSAAMLQHAVNLLLDCQSIPGFQKELSELANAFVTSPKVTKDYSVEYIAQLLGTVTRVNLFLGQVQEASNKNLSTPQKLTYELN